MQLDYAAYFSKWTLKIIGLDNMLIYQNRLGPCPSDHNTMEFLRISGMKCSKDIFHLQLPLLPSHCLTSPVSNSLKKVSLSLNRTNPPELKGIVSEFRPLTHLCLTSTIPHTQDGRSALAETNPRSLSVQTCGHSARAESGREPLAASALLNSPPKALMELSGAN